MVVLKGATLRENHRNIVKYLKFSFYSIDISAKNIAQSTALKFAIFDAKKIIFSNIDFDLRKAKIELLKVEVFVIIRFFPCSYECRLLFFKIC